MTLILVPPDSLFGGAISFLDSAISKSDMSDTDCIQRERAQGSYFVAGNVCFCGYQGYALSNPGE